MMGKWYTLESNGKEMLIHARYLTLMNKAQLFNREHYLHSARAHSLWFPQSNCIFIKLFGF